MALAPSSIATNDLSTSPYLLNDDASITTSTTTTSYGHVPSIAPPCEVISGISSLEKMSARDLDSELSRFTGRSGIIISTGTTSASEPISSNVDPEMSVLRSLLEKSYSTEYVEEQIQALRAKLAPHAREEFDLVRSRISEKLSDLEPLEIKIRGMELIEESRSILQGRDEDSAQPNGRDDYVAKDSDLFSWYESLAHAGGIAALVFLLFYIVFQTFLLATQRRARQAREPHVEEGTELAIRHVA